MFTIFENISLCLRKHLDIMTSSFVKVFCKKLAKIGLFWFHLNFCISIYFLQTRNKCDVNGVMKKTLLIRCREYFLIKKYLIRQICLLYRYMNEIRDFLKCICVYIDFCQNSATPPPPPK